VLARPGYFAPKKESEKAAATAAPTPREKLATELFASDAPTDVPDEITAESAATSLASRSCGVGIHIDVKKAAVSENRKTAASRHSHS